MPCVGWRCGSQPPFGGLEDVDEDAYRGALRMAAFEKEAQLLRAGTVATAAWEGEYRSNILPAISSLREAIL